MRGAFAVRLSDYDRRTHLAIIKLILHVCCQFCVCELLFRVVCDLELVGRVGKQKSEPE